MSTETLNPVKEPRGHSVWRPRNLVIALILLALVNFGISMLVREIALNSTISSSVEKCDAGKIDGVIVSNDQRSILIDTVGEPEDAGAPDQVVNCLIDQLRIPSTVLSDITNTNYTQGERSASWDGFKSEWSFDLHKGYQITVKRS